MSENRKIFSARLRELRTATRYSQTKLAELLGVKVQVVNDYEHERSTPSFDVLIKLADILDTPLDYLTGRRDEP